MGISTTKILAPDRQKIAKHQLQNEAVEVVENVRLYKCEISPATNDLNVVQIPKIYEFHNTVS